MNPYFVLTRRALSALALAASALAATGPLSAEPVKVLNYAFPIAETGFDPSQLSDLYSRTLTAAIFESLYRYDHLARPVQIKPLVASAMPEVEELYKDILA